MQQLAREYAWDPASMRPVALRLAKAPARKDVGGMLPQGANDQAKAKAVAPDPITVPPPARAAGSGSLLSAPPAASAVPAPASCPSDPDGKCKAASEGQLRAKSPGRSSQDSPGCKTPRQWQPTSVPLLQLCEHSLEHPRLRQL